MYLSMHLGPLFYVVGVGGAAAHLAWQVNTVDLDSFSSCLAKFRSNRDLGALVLLGTALGHV
jgi:4-hydroxybenzoate polyprenyltransferase